MWKVKMCFFFFFLKDARHNQGNWETHEDPPHEVVRQLEYLYKKPSPGKKKKVQEIKLPQL